MESALRPESVDEKSGHEPSRRSPHRPLIRSTDCIGQWKRKKCKEGCGEVEFKHEFQATDLLCHPIFTTVAQQANNTCEGHEREGNPRNCQKEVFAFHVISISPCHFPNSSATNNLRLNTVPNRDRKSTRLNSSHLVI